jgi:hypothetical protein
MPQGSPAVSLHELAMDATRLKRIPERLLSKLQNNASQAL